MDIERALLRTRDRLVAIELLTDLIAVSRPGDHDPRAFSGVADMCGELATLLGQVKKALPPETLAIELSRSRKESSS